MEQFPHLRFVQKVTGKPRYFGGGSSNERSEQNKHNREKHSSSLFGRTSGLNQEWERDLSEREKEGLPPLNKDVIPVSRLLFQFHSVIPILYSLSIIKNKRLLFLNHEVTWTGFYSFAIGIL